MALIDRMRAIQDDLKAKQVHLGDRPQMVKEWTDLLSSLYDTLEGFLSDEIKQGVCKVLRLEMEEKSEDLGLSKSPYISLSTENNISTSSSPQRANNMHPNFVHFTGRAGQYTVRISYVPNQRGGSAWAISSADNLASLDSTQPQWISQESFKKALEPFFQMPGQ